MLMSVVRGDPHMMKSILFATDFSDASQFALPYAVAHATFANAKLLLVYVKEDPAIAGEGALYTYDDDPKGDLEALDLDGFDGPVERHVVIGRPADEIVRFARDKDVDLIVVGTHGRTGIRRVLMGSVAEHVVREAPCPVLSIRMRKS